VSPPFRDPEGSGPFWHRRDDAHQEKNMKENTQTPTLPPHREAAPVDQTTFEIRHGVPGRSNKVDADPIEASLSYARPSERDRPLPLPRTLWREFRRVGERRNVGTFDAGADGYVGPADCRRLAEALRAAVEQGELATYSRVCVAVAGMMEEAARRGSGIRVEERAARG
jgi:hypothetical protein